MGHSSLLRSNGGSWLLSRKFEVPENLPGHVTLASHKMTQTRGALRGCGLDFWGVVPAKSPSQ